MAASKLLVLSFMNLQTDVNEKMRAILVDWLVEVHLKFKVRAKEIRVLHHHSSKPSA